MSSIQKDLVGALNALKQDRTSETAWAKLYDLAWPFVFAVAYRMLRGQRDLADDAGQEVFLRVLRYADFKRFDSSDELYRYLSVLTKNVCHDIVSKQGTTHQLFADPEEGMADIASDYSWATVAENRVFLRQIFEKLSNQDKQLIALLSSGFDLEDISKRLGLSYSNTGVRLHRIRRNIDKLLIENSK